jgi:D-tyrosyl-tRNA(Tyr) deacylase
VRKTSVSVGKKVIGEIDKGLFVLVGIKQGDKKEDAEILAEKLSKLRIMSDGRNKMNLSIRDVNSSILVVSQFTLHADTKKGNRPSFIKAAKPKIAEKLYTYFIKCLRKRGVKVEVGIFGEYMIIECELDGPVTIIIDSSM